MIPTMTRLGYSKLHPPELLRGKYRLGPIGIFPAHGQLGPLMLSTQLQDLDWLQSRTGEFIRRLSESIYPHLQIEVPMVFAEADQALAQNAHGGTTDPKGRWSESPAKHAGSPPASSRAPVLRPSKPRKNSGAFRSVVKLGLEEMDAIFGFDRHLHHFSSLANWG